MANIYVFFGPKARQKFSQSRECCKILYNDLGKIIEEATGESYTGHANFVNSTNLNLFWVPHSKDSTAKHDVRLTVNSKCSAQKAIKGINSLEGYCAKTD